MRRSELSLVLALLAIPLAGGVAAAGDSIPSPWLCTVPSVIVGDVAGPPIGEGFVVVVRRFSDPVPYAVVQLVFPDAGPRPLAEQEPGTSVDCATRTLTRTADASGVCAFHPRIAGFTGAPVVDVRANGVQLAQVQARSTDLDGNGRVDLADFQLFAANFLHAPLAPETDYDLSGRTDGRDLDLFRRDFVARAQGVICP
jgi:hypothetical protein